MEADNIQEQAEPHVEPFLELVKTMYANTKTVVEKEFGEKSGLRPPVS
jgi:transformation/transcription domain-associated protein